MRGKRGADRYVFVINGLSIIRSWWIQLSVNTYRYVIYFVCFIFKRRIAHIIVEDILLIHIFCYAYFFENIFIQVKINRTTENPIKDSYSFYINPFYLFLKRSMTYIFLWL